MEQQTPHTRRFCSRIDTRRDVYVYWSSADYDDTSRVRDLSSEGLFIQTRKSRAPGATTNVHFLVEEGPIRAEAIVRHVKPGRGFGLEFTAVRAEDRRHLADLMKRLRGSSLVSRLQAPGHNLQAPLQ